MKDGDRRIEGERESTRTRAREWKRKGEERERVGGYLQRATVQGREREREKERKRGSERRRERKKLATKRESERERRAQIERDRD